MQRPRRFLVRIRWILGLILVLAFVLGLAVRTLRSVKLQIDAVTAIASAGGGAYYDQDRRPRGIVAACEAIRRWSSDWVGPDYFYPVCEVLVYPPPNSDTVMEQVGQLGGLRCLRLGGRGLSDDSLRYLLRLPRLEFLTLDRTKVSDDGVKHLEALKSLKRLSLCRTRITDAGLRHVGSLAKLQALFLSETAVSDGGMVHVGKLSCLEMLDISGSRVTDAGLRHLSDLGRLRALNLSFTAVTDSGLTEVAKLKSLETLDVRSTQVTSTGAARLRRCFPRAMILEGQTNSISGAPVRRWRLACP